MLDIIFNILTSGLPCCLLALGIFLTYRLLDFADLTAEGSFLIGGASCLTLIYNGVNPFLATLIALFAGALCGLLTGIIHTKLGIPKLLSGIITLTATASIGLFIIGFTKNNDVFSNLVTLRTNDFTIFSIFYNSVMDNSLVETIVMAIIVIIVFVIIYFFFGTEYGMAIRSTGMNEDMAKSQGINVTLSKIVCITLSNALIGLAGALFAQDARAMDIKSASGFLVIGLASILIGESIFGKRNFKNWIISVGLGGILYFIIVTVAIRLGFPTQLKNLLYAVLITIALCLPLIKKGFQSLWKKIGGNKHART
ncbi:MAG: ABC transporter permease [Bacilli bacterium]|nr:ABC transporter permease [Bacilli bacterium]